MQYELNGDDAPFVKRSLKDYIRVKKKPAQFLFITGGRTYLGHYHLETEGKTREDIIGDTLKFADDIRRIISRGKMDVAEAAKVQNDT